MKRFAKSASGVTLLEVMLVLAIAAMIIVMSVRYYQQASYSQQANGATEQVQAIVAAIDQLSQASGQYTSSTVSSTAVAPLLPANGLITPWGTNITLSYTSATQYTITVSAAPAGVCPLVKTKFQSNNHFDVSGVTCDPSATTDLVLPYTSNP